MVGTPEETMTQLFSFLGLPFKSSLLSGNSDYDELFFKKRRATIHQSIGKPLIKTNIYKYRKKCLSENGYCTNYSLIRFYGDTATL